MKRIITLIALMLVTEVYAGLPFPPLPSGYHWYFAENQEPYDVYELDPTDQFEFGYDYFGAASYEDAHLAWWWDGRSSFSQPIVYLWGTVEPLAGAWSKDSQYDNNWNNFVWELGPSWPDGVYPWNNEPVFPEAPVVIKHGKKLGHNK